MAKEINIYCDICFELVAKADPDTLVYPMTGSMFTSMDPVHGYPDPFDPMATWEFMWCPFSNKTHRISQHPDAVMTDGRAYHRLLTPAEAFARRNQQQTEEKKVVEEEEEIVKDSPVNEVAPMTQEDEAQAIQEAAKVPEYDLPPDMDGDKPAMRAQPKPKEAPLPVDGFPCRICGKSCKTQFALNGHMKSHPVGDVGEEA